MQPLQIEHVGYKLLVTGKSGYGKTTYWLRALLGTPADCRFIFDHKGEVAHRLGARPAFTEDDLAQGVADGWCVFNPSVMFKGRLPDAFNFFCEFAYDMACEMPGRKIFGADELQQFVGTNSMPPELAAVIEDGRIRGLDAMLITSQPNLIHNRVRFQTTEVVTFFMDEERPLDPLIAWGFNEQEVKSLDRFNFIQRIPSLGTQERGSVR